MTQIFLALLPVFIVIMIGALLRRTNIIGALHWPGIDHVCYFVLFPAIIFKEIAAAWSYTGSASSNRPSDFKHPALLLRSAAVSECSAP